MLLLPLAAALAAPAHAARLLHSIPEDTYAFPKLRVAFLNSLPVLNETAERWLTDGLRGGELEFLDQPWSSHLHSPMSPKEIGSGDVQHGIFNSQPLIAPSAAHYTLEKMKMGPKDSYLCLIPKPADNVPPAPDDHTSDFELTPSRSWSLLQPLSGTCLYHRQGWFTYSYCHNEEIRQFKEATNSAGGHRPPQEDPDWEAYTLGKAPKPGADLTVAEQNAQAANLELARSAGSRYLVQRWGDGTPCDKTGKSREVEVQFHCSMTMTDTILFVKEAKTCSYVVVINTPRLCGEPGFKSRRDTGEEHQIRCREIVNTQPPADTPDAHPRIPDLDHPVKLPRRKPILPAPAPPKEAQVKVGGVEIKDAAYGELLRKTLEAFIGGKDVKNVALEDFSDKDGVMFEIVEEIDLTGGEHEAVEKLAETLRAAGYDIKPKSDKSEAGNNKKGTDKEQTQVENNKAKAATWREEL